MFIDAPQKNHTQKPLFASRVSHSEDGRRQIDFFTPTLTIKPLLALNHLTLVADGRFHPSIYSAFIRTRGGGDTRLITLLAHVTKARLKNEEGNICASRHDK